MKAFRILTLFICCVLSSIAFAQKSKIEKANKYYEGHAYIQAIELYHSILKSGPSDEAVIKLADSYRQINKTREAEKWYAKAVRLKSSKAIDKFHYAQILQMNGKCLEAKKWYSAYSKIEKSDKRPHLLASSCDSLHLFHEDTANYRVKELRSINSEHSDFGAVIYKKGMVFTSARTEPNKKSKLSMRDGKPYLNMYFSPNFRQSKFAMVYLFHDKVNSKFHDGPATFNKDFTEIYFTRNGKGKGGARRLKIFTAKLVGENWKELESLPFNSHDYSVGHPCLSPDGKSLYFTSDMKGGLGGTDIWVVTKNGSNWTAPKNLGPLINTKGNEMFPHVTDSVFYFSSNGHPGLGGLDIYRATLVKGRLEDVENMGAPLNSSYDDFGLTIGRQPYIGYISSNRPGGVGSDDLYEFQDLHQVKIVNLSLEGILTKKENDKEVPIAGATVTLLDEDDKEVTKIMTKSDGAFKFNVQSEKEYTIVAKKDNFFTDRKNVSTYGKGRPPEVNASVKMEAKEIVLNQENVIPNIYYEYNKWEVTPQITMELDKLVILLKDNPNLIIEIGSHTDDRGNASFNLKLSQKRAEGVMEYLASRGVSKNRMSARGYGKTKPIIAAAQTEEDHSKNRRTEFTVTMIRQNH